MTAIRAALVLGMTLLFAGRAAAGPDHLNDPYFAWVLLLGGIAMVGFVAFAGVCLLVFLFHRPQPRRRYPRMSEAKPAPSFDLPDDAPQS